ATADAAFERGTALLGALFLPLLFVSPAFGAPPMSYVYHLPESSRDVRYVYHWEILKAALERTTPAWGPYRLVAAAKPMSETRQAYELEHGSGKLTVMYLGTTPDFERALVPVRIPVDKNLGGYCVFLIRKGDEPRFERVRSLDDLRSFSYGLGLGWLDVRILRASGFRVVTGSSYEGLFEMLANGRFDVFLRAAVEVLDEFESHRNALPQLAVEKSLLFYYPLPMYFWFSRSKEGRRLAARAEQGMRAMIADGTYDLIFELYQRPKIDRLNLKKRRMFRIENPLVGPETPFADKKLWFDLEAER
ncbi:MAG TPA: hypothetical protein VGR00_06940, partial [Thermoanaerobaculia bacterium]|nr:hypothetical protein [Thermoanaerobaculia bacterium]